MVLIAQVTKSCVYRILYNIHYLCDEMAQKGIRISVRSGKERERLD